MSKIIIGCDPDSKAHGVAIYEDGKLAGLESMPLMAIHLLFARWSLDGISISDIQVNIEDVCANNAVFRAGGNAKVNMSIARRLGMVQQSQVELERLFEYYKIKIVKHKISKMWKKDKAQFERVTGWTGRSTEDTRSAAYFGFLGLK
jgi:hypothetical protein